MQKTKTEQKRKFVEPTLKKEASLVDGTLGVTSGGIIQISLDRPI